VVFRAERYAKDWKFIRATILQRAGRACECTGQCGDPHEGGRCGAPGGVYIARETKVPWRWTRCESKAVHGDDVRHLIVVLTVAHLNHDEKDNREENLAAFCQRCHLKYDAADNAQRRKANAAQTPRGQGRLPGLGG